MNWKHKSVLNLVKENKPISEDPVQLIREKSSKLTLEAFSKGWNGPPFNVIELAGLLNIEVMPNDAVNDARIIPNDNGGFQIEYNPYNKISRINFSIAHEIGHSLFPDCNDLIRNRINNAYTFEDDSWELEFLCNIAAAEILLPVSTFYSEANKVNININDLLYLSNRYEVSIESLFIRFTQVVEKPCNTMIAKFSDLERSKLIVQYGNSSISSDLEIGSGFEIPNESCAYECKNSGWTDSSIENWPEFDSKSQLINAIGLPPVKGEKNQRVGLLITPYIPSPFNGNKFKSVFGDATEPSGKGVKIIAQVVNSYGAVGFGFGKAMAKRYPIIKGVITEWKKQTSFILGDNKLVQLSKDTYVFMMITQKGLYSNDGGTTLDYDSLRSCLRILSKKTKDLQASVHMPLIGAGQARGDWEIIKNMIFDELIKNNIEVKLYIMPGTPLSNSTNYNVLEEI